jgi:pepF/M3 family oligoendopeptidase
MVATTQTLPHWDMSQVFPGLDSTEFEEGFRSVAEGISSLERIFDNYHIGALEAGPFDDGTVQVFEEVLQQYNAVMEESHTLGSYINSFVTTDSRNALAQARLSEFQQQGVRLAKLGTRLTAWLGSLPVDELVERSQVARDHAFTLERAKIRAEHLMSPAEEELAAELSVTGGSAWNKLHGNLTSQLMVPIVLDGQKQDMPMSMVRNLAFEADREVRRAGYEAELAAWKRTALPLAAAMNSIKGEVNTLSGRRKWDSALDAAIFAANIDRQTLDAMMEAARESFPDFRRDLRAKARALGVEKLAWYDMFAPVGKASKVWEYGDAADFIVEQFGAYSQKMSDFAARAFREDWIDAEPREGKRDGAFCMWLRGDESRVLTNYKSAYRGMGTLAHELGHAYHNFVKLGRTYLQRATPMTLAETASIFCETIVRNAALEHADEEEQLYILEASLQDSCQVVVDISSRFLFEQAVFGKRQGRELSVEELNDLMLSAQRDTYGDGLDEEKLHPYMWAVKPHYYSSGLSYYNFPYMFGLLFGLGLYACYLDDPEAFKEGYDDLLSSTGLADAATLAGRFGIDIRTPDFWRASLDVIRADVDRFEQLTGR